MLLQPQIHAGTTAWQHLVFKTGPGTLQIRTQQLVLLWHKDICY